MEHLIVFGGKGGVGKSSLSAATALFIAKALPEKKILLVSFDIAHNLSDLFEMPIGNDITQITSNFFAIEPEPSRYTENYVGELTNKSRQLFKSSIILNIIPELEEIIEEAVQSENIPLAMKNSLFFQSILDAENPMADIGEERLTYKAIGQTDDTPYAERSIIPPFDIIVCDFPPTGNMIALFELPADSTRRLMKISLKTSASITKHINQLRKISRFFKPATWLAKKQISNMGNENISKDHQLDPDEKRNLAQEILDILRDMEKRSKKIAHLMKNKGSLRLVSIPEKPSFEEAKRARILSSPYISVDAVHINRIIPQEEQGQSPYLDQIIKNQEKYQIEITRAFSDLKIWESPLLRNPPMGIQGLLELAKVVYFETSIDEILKPENAKMIQKSS
jgi:arsenite-transporting ATPase